MKLRDFLQWGEQALALNHAELAEEIARYLLKQSPSNLAARTLLGNVYLQSGQMEEAEEHLLQALDMDPESPDTLTSLAEVLETQGRDEERLAVIRRAFECDPTRTDVKQRLMTLRQEVEDAAHENGLLTRVGLARIHLRSGLLEHAIAEFRYVLEETQIHWSARVALMEAHWLNGERQAASGIADEIVREHPNCLKAILLSADVRAHMGLIDQARQLLERARQVDPDFTLARALYPANGPSRLPLPNDDAEIEVPIDFLQRIEATLAAKEEPEEGDARTRAAERISARAATDAQEERKRILVTPAQDTAPEKDEPPAVEPPPAASAAPDAGKSGESAENWDALLRKLEQAGPQMDEPTLAALAQQLEAIAAAAPNRLQAWQQLGDVYQRIEETDRAMRAYMRALDSSSESRQ
ncbi:MAG: tetratricopeptide repeat protein [Chloroflexota bacterium]|nr:tetratricopeptide repeat protein [Chloroflexota bacterium]MDE2840716.1 tetratricopeptide repeat protein [Chloroflexota bacterium]MDE2931750.1 tetratricopeptide repeat protein [Chloroflexota bacterium]